MDSPISDNSIVALELLDSKSQIDDLYYKIIHNQGSTNPVVDVPQDKFVNGILSECIVYEAFLGTIPYGCIIIEKIMGDFDIVSHFCSYNVGARWAKVCVAKTAITMLRDSLGIRNIYGNMSSSNSLAIAFVKLIGFEKVDFNEKQKYINYSGIFKCDELYINRR